MYLRRRLNTALLQWSLLLAVFAGTVWAMSLPAIRRHLIDERVLLARTIAHAIDGTMSASIQSLGRLAADLPDDPAAGSSQLRRFRFESFFNEAIYVTDAAGTIVAADPADTDPIDSKWLADREAVTSAVQKPADSGRSVLAIVQPFQRQGRRYFLVAETTPAKSHVSTFLKDLKPGSSMHVHLIDQGGRVIASDDRAALLQRLAEPDGVLSVQASLQYAPWSVVVRQPDAHAFFPLAATGRGLILTGLFIAVTGVLLSRTLSRSIVSPIRQLSRQAERMRAGDLASAITVAGDREIAMLADTLDDARARLASTLSELQEFNQRLEEQVAARTRVIAQQGEQRKVLLRRMMNATEDERRRLARELHDEIAQLLTVIQLSLHHIHVDTPEMRRANALLVQTQQEIHRIIHDLRPATLDDLGLAAAMKSYADEHLRRQGIEVSLEIEQGLTATPEIETVVFRIYQELVTNILRHAKADHVSIELYRRDGALILAVEDDGEGFDPEAKSEGAGIIGMGERAALVNGSISFDSEDGLGTHARLEIPLQ